MKILRTTNQTMRQLVTSHLLAFHRHRRKATAVLALKIVAAAALVAVISLQLTAILTEEAGPATPGKWQEKEIKALRPYFWTLTPWVTWPPNIILIIHVYQYLDISIDIYYTTNSRLDSRLGVKASISMGMSKNRASGKNVVQHL